MDQNDVLLFEDGNLSRYLYDHCWATRRLFADDLPVSDSCSVSWGIHYVCHGFMGHCINYCFLNDIHMNTQIITNGWWTSFQLYGLVSTKHFAIFSETWQVAKAWLLRSAAGSEQVRVCACALREFGKNETLLFLDFKFSFQYLHIQITYTLHLQQYFCFIFILNNKYEPF